MRNTSPRKYDDGTLSLTICTTEANHKKLVTWSRATVVRAGYATHIYRDSQGTARLYTIYIYIYMHSHTFLYKYACHYVCMYTNIHMCIRRNRYTDRHICIYTHIRIYLHISITCMCIHMYICMYVCIHIYIYRERERGTVTPLGALAHQVGLFDGTPLRGHHHHISAPVCIAVDELLGDVGHHFLWC